MGEQRLHHALAPIDVLTRSDMEAVLHKELEDTIRAQYRGVEIQRFPRLATVATATTPINLGAGVTGGGSSDPLIGPESGDIWQMRRAIVKSTSFTDNAKYILFKGSTPSDTANSYTSQFLLDGFSAAVAAPVPSQPAVPASGVAQQNVNQFPVQVVISPNGATITNVSVNGVTVGTAAGTYTVPANGAISITYSVATPTWVWSNLNVAVPMGLNVNVGYYPGNKAVFLQPGEQLYALITNPVVGNTYQLDGEAIRVPAEMKGKTVL